MLLNLFKMKTNTTIMGSYECQRPPYPDERDGSKKLTFRNYHRNSCACTISILLIFVDTSLKTSATQKESHILFHHRTITCHQPFIMMKVANHSAEKGKEKSSEKKLLAIFARGKYGKPNKQQLHLPE